jgi:hypothetical protein
VVRCLELRVFWFVCDGSMGSVAAVTGSAHCVPGTPTVTRLAGSSRSLRLLVPHAAAVIWYSHIHMCLLCVSPPACLPADLPACHSA